MAVTKPREKIPKVQTPNVYAGPLVELAREPKFLVTREEEQSPVILQPMYCVVYIL